MARDGWAEMRKYAGNREKTYPIDGQALKQVIKRRMAIKDAAALIGVNRPVVSEWIGYNTLPFCHFLKLKSVLDLSEEEVRAIFSPTLDKLGIY